MNIDPRTGAETGSADLSRFLTVAESVTVTGLSKRTIERALATGAIPAYRVGLGRGRVRIDLADLTAFITPRPALRARVVAHDPRTAPTRSDKGFTLIELLVVVIIIGILAGIAIPVFLNQKARAYDTAVKADAKSVATQLESYFAGGGSWDQVRALRGGVTSAELSVTIAQWNATSGLPPLTVSAGTSGTITAVRAPGTTDWRHAHPDGDFCIALSSTKATRYRYTGGGGLAYGTMFLWDPSLGGAVPFTTEAAAVKGGGAPSCDGWARRWLNAGGIV